METREQQINKILSGIKDHWDSPHDLSKDAIQLSMLLAGFSYEVSNAELAETQAALIYLDSVDIETSKKMSNTEAEKRAKVDTNNEYSRLDLFYRGVQETINSIKKRIDSMTQMIKFER